MKKSKFFMASGTIVLAVAAVFATKANKKFAQVQTGYANSGSYLFQAAPGINIMTTVASTAPNLVVKLVTATGAHQLGSLSSIIRTGTSAASKALYFK